MGALSRETGLPVTFAALKSIAKELPLTEQIAEMTRQNASGANIVAQIALRGNGILMAWRGTVHPFKFKPSWAEIDTAPWAEQWAKISDPAWKAKLLAEPDLIPESDVQALLYAVAQGFMLHYEMGEDFNYEPTQAETIAARAVAAGVSPAEYSYDLLSANEGTGFIYFPILNYADGNLDFVEGLLHRDDTVISLSDGGAHCGTICDAASPTFLLQHWVRDRTRGTVTIENAIKRQCSDTARLYGMNDRGQLVPGMLADINLIDMAALKLGKPWMAFDLPAGGRRLLQKADGYVATIKNGVVTFRNGTMTGALPGSLVRGPQEATIVALAAE
jgi:N-acyl-D-amino-acid deacylase